MQSMTAILEHLEQCRINNFPVSNRRWEFESHPHRHIIFSNLRVDVVGARNARLLDPAPAVTS